MIPLWLIVEVWQQITGAWCWWRHKGQHRVLRVDLGKQILAMKCRQCKRTLVKRMTVGELGAYIEALAERRNP